jgi:hypothetical protein
MNPIVKGPSWIIRCSMHAAIAVVWMYKMVATLVLALEILMEAILTFLMIANKVCTQFSAVLLFVIVIYL